MLRYLENNSELYIHTATANIQNQSSIQSRKQTRKCHKPLADFPLEVGICVTPARVIVLCVTALEALYLN